MQTPQWVLSLPAVNAGLNGLATVLLVVGYLLIRQRKTGAHKAVMLSAFVTSILFLGCYLLYHAALREYTGSGSHAFTGLGPIRTIYFTILITHIVLAALVPILASITIYRGLRADWPRHRRIAKITFPIWLYVSVTGVIIYFMLYHWTEG